LRRQQFVGCAIVAGVVTFDPSVVGFHFRRQAWSARSSQSAADYQARLSSRRVAKLPCAVAILARCSTWALSSLWSMVSLAASRLALCHGAHVTSRSLSTRIGIVARCCLSFLILRVNKASQDSPSWSSQSRLGDFEPSAALCSLHRKDCGLPVVFERQSTSLSLYRIVHPSLGWSFPGIAWA
jgi:hypothetical protein